MPFCPLEITFGLGLSTVWVRRSATVNVSAILASCLRNFRIRQAT